MSSALDSARDEVEDDPPAESPAAVAPRLRTMNDLPHELLDNILIYMDNIQDAVAVSQTARSLRTWWRSARPQHALRLTRLSIPGYVWPLSIACTKAWPRDLLSLEDMKEASAVLLPFVTQLRRGPDRELSNKELVDMVRRHEMATVHDISSMRGHAQLHEVAMALLPQSQGELDHPLVRERFQPLCYALFIARTLAPAMNDDPRCCYDYIPDWFMELALGVMLDLKPTGWWEGFRPHFRESQIRGAVKRFFLAQRVRAHLEGGYGYLA